MTEETQTTLRDVLSASFEQIEAGSSNEKITETSSDRVRDDQGKFSKAETDSKSLEIKPEIKPEIKAEVKPNLVSEVKEEKTNRPTTWKKEYLPLWDKLATGVPLTPEESTKLMSYTSQRENEYKSGVSTYKAEAENAKQLQEAVAPFLPTLQQHNIPVNQWIRNLGNAHHTLALGTPEQKIQMFTRLAQEYGVPVNMIAGAQQGAQPDQTSMQLMQELATLKQQIAGVSAWRDQSESQVIEQQISQFKDTTKYPYFEMVRGNMAQLLESGQAHDLQSAYETASAPLEDVINSRLEQAGAQHKQQSTQQAVNQAKAKAVSPKSSTPSGSVTTSSAKDRRSILSEQVDALMGGARV